MTEELKAAPDDLAAAIARIEERLERIEGALGIGGGDKGPMTKAAQAEMALGETP